MTRPIVELCIHGNAREHPFPDCPGGRVLEGAIIIERDADGSWPEWVNSIAYDDESYTPLATRQDVTKFFDALASAQEDQ